MKKCEFCGNILLKRKTEKPCLFRIRKFCNNSCAQYWNTKNNKKWIEAVRRPRTEQEKEKIRQAKLGDKNPMWKESPKRQALHEWVIRRLGYKKVCSNCGATKNIDATNISGEYKREIDDWKYLCRKCHMESDGRLNKFNLMHNKTIKLSFEETNTIDEREVI